MGRHAKDLHTLCRDFLSVLRVFPDDPSTDPACPPWLIPEIYRFKLRAPFSLSRPAGAGPRRRPRGPDSLPRRRTCLGMGWILGRARRGLLSEGRGLALSAVSRLEQHVLARGGRLTQHGTDVVAGAVAGDEIIPHNTVRGTHEDLLLRQQQQ